MNRVKKISRKYDRQKPEIDRLRQVRTHTRRMHRAAQKALKSQQEIEAHKEEMKTYTVKELRNMAKVADISGRSKMNKTQLIESLAKV